MIGRLLSGRYRIEAKVGSGGMAVVYRACDLQTDLPVAVKVLRPEYEADMDFVLRFSREAEAAAKVSHENIVNLLDVGIDGETRYIVMECVDGSTLKEMIRDEGRIHPDLALRMAIRILAAVDHAHRNGIVHRDIKPQNILVDREGRIKVADFGIARLKTIQGTQADADGNAMGSVHYLSPEQARGELADEQSDLYSVGVVLYEMLTGTVPFDGDTAMSVARKHIEETPQSVRRLNPHISRALDEVITRALSKDKALRYQSAAEMAADLRKTLTHPRGGFVRYPVPKDGADTGKKKKKSSQRSERRRMARRVLTVLSVLIVLLALAVGGLFYLRIRSGERMPELMGMPEAAAVQTLEEMGMNVTVVNAYSEDYGAGRVMLQSTVPRERLRKGSEVVLTVSLGMQRYELPDVIGWTSDAAVSALTEAGASHVNVEYVQSARPVGAVDSTQPMAGSAMRDVPVTVYVSGRSVALPSLLGMTVEGARAVIEAAGLRVGELIENDARDAKPGTVIAQSVHAQTQVLADTTVNLTICRARSVKYAPDSPLTLVVPLDDVRVSVSLTTPSGQSIEAYAGTLDEGTHRVSLASSEAGVHNARVFMDDVLFENLEIVFE